MNPSEIPRPWSYEELSRAVRETLHRLETDLEEILDGSAAWDPVAFVDRFDQDRESLEAVLRQLRTLLDRQCTSGAADLNAFASAALEEMLTVLEKPLILKVSWQPELPAVDVPVDPLRAVLQRVLSLVAREAQAGDVLSVRTGRTGREGQLSIVLESAQGRPRDDAGREQLELRSRSLHDFVGELGGRFESDEEGGLRFRLTLPLGVEAR